MRKKLWALLISVFWAGDAISALAPISSDTGLTFPDLLDSRLACLAVVFVFAACLLVIVHLRRVIKSHEQADKSQTYYNRILDSVARNASLEETFTVIIKSIENERPGVIVSLMMFEQNERRSAPGATSSPVKTSIRHFASGIDSTVSVCQDCSLCTLDGGCAPVLPPSQAPCQQAILDRRPVILDTLANDPAFPGASTLGITSLWSEPVLSENGETLAVITFYYRSGYQRETRDLQLMETASNLVKVVVEQCRAACEARLMRELVEHLHDPVYIAAPEDDFRLRYANAAAIRFFGHSPEKIPNLRVPDFDLNHSGDWLQDLWVHFKDGETPTDNPVETLYATAEQESVPVETTLHRLSHEGQEYLAGYFRDISQRKKHENEVIKSKQVAEQALAARNRFLSHMSHELRTPLNGILGLSHLALTTELPDITREYIEKIQYSGTNLLSLISDILDFSRIEEGGMVINPVAFNLQTVVKTVLDMKQFGLMAKNLMMICQIERRVPTYLKGDAERLQQILLNLVDNAVKFTHAGSITLNVDSRMESGRCWLQFRVRDTGIGIAPKDQERMFKPFMQLDDSNHRRYGGSGLGLAISNKLVGLMGGQGIDVTSTPDLGSVFSFELPFEPVENSDVALDSNHNATVAPLKGFNILIVEDNKINQTVAKSIVGRLGARTTVVDNGQEAVDLLTGQSQNFDAILMDIQMPVMDGYTATRRIRQTLKLVNIPIIAVTAHTMDSDRDACLQSGMNAHLGKPIEANRLVSLLMALCTDDPGNIPLQQQRQNPVLTLVTLMQTTMDKTFQDALQGLPEAIQKMDNDENLYCDMARLFMQEEQHDINKIREFCRQRNYSEARRILHTLKGLAETLGLATLHKASLSLYLAFHQVFRSEQHELLESELMVIEVEMAIAHRALNELLTAWGLVSGIEAGE